VVRRGTEALAGGSLEIDVSLLESPRVGDFVLVHAGYAIGTVDRLEAEETLRLLGESDPRA
jgi:hydrogenase expression/formation protein HypC